jgi:hypothetical protein
MEGAMPDPTPPAAPLAERLREIRTRLDAASPGDWAYRPQELDDWGVVRGGPDQEGLRWVVACARAGMPGGDHDSHRRAGTDPYRANGEFIAGAKQDVPFLLDALDDRDAEIARLARDRERLGKLLQSMRRISRVFAAAYRREADTLRQNIADERARADAAEAQRDRLAEALRELLTDVVIAQGNMRDAAKRDPRWEGCAEAIQPRVDAARAALAGEAPDAATQKADQAPSEQPWPAYCHSPSSCTRNGHCTYTNCRHGTGRDIRQDIAAHEAKAAGLRAGEAADGH